MPRIVIQRVVVGKRVILLGDGEDDQGENVPHELIHVGERGQQHRRDEGVGAQEQESVAGVVFVVIGRGVAAASPHGKAGESLTQHFAPHRPLRSCAAQPQRRPRNLCDVPAGKQTRWG